MNIAILFSGQGLQKPEHYEELKVLAQEGVSGLSEWLAATTFDQEKLYANEYAQPFIVALQYARWRHLAPHLSAHSLIFCGYSLGELTAFCTSGQLSFADSLHLATQRGQLMSKACPQAAGLLSVQGINEISLLPMLASTQTEIAIRITPASCIVGGTEPQLADLEQLLQQENIQSHKRLNVSIPSHTSLMHQAAQPFRQALQAHENIRLMQPIISGSAGNKIFSAAEAIHCLTAQIEQMIDWHTCMVALQENNPDIVIEIGPGSALTKMAAEIMPHVPIRCWDDFQTPAGLLAWIERHIIN